MEEFLLNIFLGNEIKLEQETLYHESVKNQFGLLNYAH